MKGYLVLIISVFALTSCSNYYTFSEKRTTSLTPDFVRLDVTLDDFEYLGKTEISVKTREYLGFITVIDSVNNRAYNYRDVRIVNLTGPRDIKLNAEMQKAAYKVIDEYPDATYYVIANDYKKIHRLFLGKWTLRTMEIHAYKYKVDN